MSFSKPVALLACLALLAGARRAAADKFDSTLDVSVHAISAVTDAGVALGPAGRVGMSLEGFKIGAGIGTFRIGAMPRDADPPGAWHTGAGAAWGVPLETYAGYMFGSPRGLRPYFEVRALETYFWSSGGSHGAWLFGLAGRVGARTWLSEYFFVDLGAGVGLTGPERASVSLSFGLPIPTANL